MLVMGLGQKFLTRVGLAQFFVARVGSAIYGLGLNLENFCLKHQIFQFFLFGSGQKVPGLKAGRPLIYCGSKVSLGQGLSLAQSL